MPNPRNLSGVFAAAVTPLKPDYSLDIESVPAYLDFLFRRGCHGALLLGTTGEGPSFAPEERLDLWKAALTIRQDHPDFRILAGTGTPSLEETVSLTRAAFDLGLDGVVVIPPYYFRKVTEDGLCAWFSQVIRRAVPEGGALLGYHFPAVSGVPISIELMSRLKDTFPDRFAGLKDSSGEPEHAIELGHRFGKELAIMNGNDRLFSLALDNNASGCITAMSSLHSPDLYLVWEASLRGEHDAQAQGRLTKRREVIDRYPPAAPLLKALLARFCNFPLWSVRPPLLPAPAEIVEEAAEEMSRVV